PSSTSSLERRPSAAGRTASGDASPDALEQLRDLSEVLNPDWLHAHRAEDSLLQSPVLASNLRDEGREPRLGLVKDARTFSLEPRCLLDGALVELVDLLGSCDRVVRLLQDREVLPALRRPAAGVQEAPHVRIGQR